MCPQVGKRYEQIVHGSEIRSAEKKKTKKKNSEKPNCWDIEVVLQSEKSYGDN